MPRTLSVTTKQSDVEESPYGCGHPTGSTQCARQYSDGYEAGFRGDELVVEKEKCYMAGYEAGQVAKMLETGDFSNVKREA